MIYLYYEFNGTVLTTLLYEMYGITTKVVNPYELIFLPKLIRSKSMGLFF